MKFILRILLEVGLAIMSVATQAVTLASFDALPAPIAACISSTTCVVASNSSFDAEGIAAFQFSEVGTTGYLVRYPVVPPSSSSVANFGGDVPLSGSLWMQVADRYSVAAPGHPVVLYLDQVDPRGQVVRRPFFPFFGSTLTALNFELSSDALLASHAFRMTGDGDFPNAGDLIAREPPLQCLASGCGVNLELNLIGLHFQQSGPDLLLSFDPQDHRRQLYLEENYYFGVVEQQYGDVTRLFVQPIPLPGVGAALCVGVLAIRRKIAGRACGTA